MNGLSREATQELGGRKTPTVIESAYNKARAEEVIPETRPAINKACPIGRFGRLDDDSFVLGKEAFC